MTPMPPPPPPPDAAFADLRSEGGSSPTSKVASCFRASCEWPTSSKSSVASCPTRSSKTSSPPGWSSRYLLTSITFPPMIIHASAGPECVATSARVMNFLPLESTSGSFSSSEPSTICVKRGRLRDPAC
eukprot:CAMPEP_0118815860 /NCGR_PEP_ID=MMETSP1162-20130426/4431_1 /TAXON_ID=33656 /ORGANISM="Phaeocystis Sp, Strain CCMP2710" /LENGTH=128 /DNA_ID=CAMNT_0006745845 /DNA_START=207 /DNA_END=593 /DNA_ORIENTATION=+